MPMISNAEIERLAQQNMKLLKIPYEEAYQLVLDDLSDEMLPEQKALTEKAKSMGRHYETSTKERKKINRPRKVNENKGFILDELEITLENIQATITGRKTETEIYFDFENKHYTLKLTEHRENKKK